MPCVYYFHTKFRSYISIHGWYIATSGFDFYIIFVIDVLSCICLPNFAVIGRPTAQLWRHIDFSRWRPQIQKYTSGFRFSDCTRFRRSKSISIPNFDHTSQSTADLTTTGFGKRTAAIVKFYFRFRFWPNNHRHSSPSSSVSYICYHLHF